MTSRTDSTATRRAAARLATGFALAAVSLAAACGGGPPAQAPDESAATEISGPREGASSDAPGVFFPERRPGGEDMLAEIRGELVLDDRGCIHVRDSGASFAIIWPTGFKAEKSDGRVRIVDRDGKVVAKVGEAVYLVGGETPIRGNEAVDDRTRRVLLERCPGSYWVAALPIRMPPQE